jgi:hypothetical protein
MRVVALALTAFAVPAAFLMQPVSAASATETTGSSPVLGQLAYITASGALDLTSVSADGSITPPQQIGPVTTVPAGGTDTIYGPVTSAGGSWLAWSENVQNGTHYSSWIVLRRTSDGQIDKLNTSKNDAAPVGFVGQHLVVGTFSKVWVVKTGARPTLRLLASSRKDGSFFGTDQAGVVYERGFAVPGAPERIELLGLDGRSTLLHTFSGSMFKGNRAPLEQGWVDPDGLDVVFEQGDHTDFGGVGPISQAFAISGLRPSKLAEELGHPGKSSPIRRMAGTSFAADVPYSVWALTDQQVPTGGVYSNDGHGWQLVASDSLVVAGNQAGDVITQPAKFVDAGVEAPAYNIQPTSNAVLHVGTDTFPVALQSSAMVWLD